jgi:predicted TIM-barrel fold metal-dependent hydrolase
MSAAPETVAATQPRTPTKPRNALPAGSCDTHAHVFGPLAKYPLAHPAGYDVPDAPLAKYLQMLDIVGQARGVLAQPAPYGRDHSIIKDAIANSGGRLRGVGAADASVTPGELRALRDAGFRGLRFTDMLNAVGKPFPGAVSCSEIAALAPYMKAADLHIDIWAPVDFHAENLPRLVGHGLPIVLDHMGMLQTRRGTSDAAFQQLLKHLADGDIWVKLSVCRVSTAAPEYPDLQEFHQMLIDANPDQVIWGSDWPHVRLGDKAPDPGALVDRVFEWVPDATLRKKLFVDNPAKLYGF